MPTSQPTSTSPAREPFLARLGRWAVRRRRAVLLTWIAILLVAVVGGPKIAGEWAADYATPGSESKLVNERLQQEFPNASAETLQIAWTAPAGATAPAVSAHITKQLSRVAKIDGFREAELASAVVSPDGKSGLIFVALTDRYAAIALKSGPELLSVANAASKDGVRVHFGGFVMQASELSAVSSEGIGLAIALLILLGTFGTLVAAGLPIATALFGLGTGAAVVTALANVVVVPDWAESVAAMVGIGVGIDYALLILTRHRAALHGGASVEDSVAYALATAGRSVLVAGGTVVISLLGLLLMGLPYLVGVAFAASSSVLIVMVASLTLLPALLGFAGHKIDALAIPLPGGKRRKAQAEQRRQDDAGLPADASANFARWSRSVQRRPWLGVVVGLTIIGLLTAPVAGVRLGFPSAGDKPVGTQAREASEMLDAAFGPGISAPMSILVPYDTPQERAAMRELRRALKADPGIASVSNPATRSTDGTTVLVTAQAKTAPEDPVSDKLLVRVRDQLIPASAPAALVGGLAAETHDQSRATMRGLPLLFLGVAGMTALLLLAAFRSILIPIKAAVMNLFSIGAAYGVVALVAEGGTVGQLVGLNGEVPIPPFIPVLMFAVLFGLSMDYEVFLLGRIREVWLETGDAQRSVTDGLAATGRVITAAAAIMVAVFGAFALSPEIFLKLTGIGMAVAIFVDATVIRLLLVPAFMSLMGEWNWWLPKWLDRLVPEAKLEASAMFPAPPEAARPRGPVKVPEPFSAGRY